MFSIKAKRNINDPKRAFRQGALVLLALLITSMVAGLQPSRVAATGLPVVHKSGTLYSNETWVTGSVYYVDSSVTIPDGVTLTIDPGAIVKFSSNWGYGGISVASGGVLNAIGTTAYPITFTSYADDSNGGDSNSDGSSSGAIGDYDQVIAVQSYSSNVAVNISHAIFEYGQKSLYMNCYSDGSIAVAINDSTIKSQIYSYAGHDCGVQPLTMQRNTITLDGSDTSQAMYIPELDPSGIMLAGTDSNNFVGSGTQRVMYVAGNIAQGNTWSLDGASNVVIASSGLNIAGTVDIGAGAIIKTVGSSNNALNLISDGELNISGSTAEPAVFTSYVDDSQGGDSNGDGSSSGAPGDYEAAISLQPYSSNAIVNGAHAVFENGNKSLYFNCYDSGGGIDFTINDSLIKNQIASYVGEKCGQAPLKMNRNTIALDAGDNNRAMYILGLDPSGITLQGSDGNSFVGNDRHRVVYVGTNLPGGSSWSVDGSGGAVIVSNGLSTAGTIDIGPGAIIKAADSSVSSLSLLTNGSINVAGTSGDPVIFTSYADDSNGGDSNGDGSSSGAPGDYKAALEIQAETGANSVSASNAEFLYGSKSLYVNCYDTSSESSVIASDNVVKAPMVVGCRTTAVDLKRNQFDIPTSLNKEAIVAGGSDPSGIVLAGSNKNIFSGTGKSILVSAEGTVGTGNTWLIDGSGGAVVATSGVNIAGTVSIGPGAIIKNSSYQSIFEVLNGGDLDITGSSALPVHLTSYADDSKGGDSNGGGSSSGAKNDYQMVIKADTGSSVSVSYATMNYDTIALNASYVDITMDHTTINDGAVYLDGGESLMTEMNMSNIGSGSSDSALTLSRGAKVTYRGSFSNITGKAVKACDWDSSDTCMADVAYTDWGSSDGPFDSVSHASDLVCGSVMVGPWIHGVTTYPADDIYAVLNCSGSPTPSGAIQTSASDFASRIAEINSDCSLGDQDACDYAQRVYQCMGAAMTLAQSTAPWPLPASSTASQVDAIGGVIRGSAADYLNGQTLASPAGMSLGLFNTILSVTSTILNINSAYNSCF